MNKEQFLKLIREISGQIQDIEVRRDYLENKFIQFGYSIESGYKVVSHYYNELKKAREGQPTVYDGKFIHNEIDKTFALVTNGSCLFKMTFSGFDGLGTLFEKPHQQTETANQYEQSVRINYLASKEDAERLGCKVGEPVSYIPEPINIDEMFERLQNIYGLRVAEAYQQIFKEKYGNGNIKTVSDELNEIKKFIDEAEKLPTTETFKKGYNNNSSLTKYINNGLYLSHLVEYSRLKFEYYRKEQFISSFNSFFSSYSAEVYGKYFLYKQWLEEKLNELNKEFAPQLSEKETDQEKLLTLDKVFESISKYKFIMELLANNEFIQPNTYIWKDEKRSNKATLISVLKILHKQGFYKNNKELKHYEIKDIALNTFGIGISISHIKQHKLNTAEKAVKLIPIASTVK